jgi:hypothetical protein
MLWKSLSCERAIKSDAAGMAQEQWFAGKPEVEHFGLSLASDSAAYSGHLSKARALTTEAVNSAIQADNMEKCPAAKPRSEVLKMQKRYTAEG